MDPRIYLGIDNCFASKRWIRPAEWMKLIRSVGLKYVEASADTECDPLYMGEAFTKEWIEDVQAESKKQGVVVKNIFSGHGTYVTSGLSHYSSRVIERFRDEWMKKQIDTGNALNAGFGFFAHGFEELLIQDGEKYRAKLEEMYDTLADIADYAKRSGMRYVSLEQMYSPHQPPWRIGEAETLLREVYRRGGKPFYLTLDLGHMNGQQYFVKPDPERIMQAIENGKNGEPERNFWVGTQRARMLYEDAIAGRLAAKDAVTRIVEDMEKNLHLFANTEDYSVDRWVRRLGCYSPIVHLQQSDGKSSPHWLFTRRLNEKGIIFPDRFLAALADSYQQPEDASLPPKCDEIVLTLEPFISTAGNVYDLVDDLRESVQYWRKWIPEDGMKLSEIRNL